MKKGKYIGLYLLFLRTSFIREMNYRFNFILMAVTTIFLNVYFIAFYLVLAQLSNDNFLGWNKYQLLFFLGTEIICHSLFMSFCFYNVFSLPEEINTGNFDFLLLQPVNTRFNLSTSHIDISMFTQTILGVGLCVFSACNLKLTVTLAEIAVYIVLIINSIFLMYLISFGLMSISFFFGKIFTSGSSFPYRGFFSLYWFARRPQSIYPKIFNNILTYVIPLMLIINLPVNTILNDINYHLTLYAFLTTFVVYKITTKIWRKGLLRYESAGS